VEVGAGKYSGNCCAAVRPAGAKLENYPSAYIKK
jgi:hypothetical protein